MRAAFFWGLLCLLLPGVSGLDMANAQQLEKALSLWASSKDTAEYSIKNGEFMFRGLTHSCFASEHRAKIADIDFSKSYLTENHDIGYGYVFFVCKGAKDCIEQKFGTKVWLAAQRCTRDSKPENHIIRENIHEAFFPGVPMPIAQEILRLLKAN